MKSTLSLTFLPEQKSIAEIRLEKKEMCSQKFEGELLSSVVENSSHGTCYCAAYPCTIPSAFCLYSLLPCRENEPIDGSKGKCRLFKIMKRH